MNNSKQSIRTTSRTPMKKDERQEQLVVACLPRDVTKKGKKNWPTIRGHMGGKTWGRVTGFMKATFPGKKIRLKEKKRGGRNGACTINYRGLKVRSQSHASFRAFHSEVGKKKKEGWLSFPR